MTDGCRLVMINLCRLFCRCLDVVLVMESGEEGNVYFYFVSNSNVMYVRYIYLLVVGTEVGKPSIVEALGPANTGRVSITWQDIYHYYFETLCSLDVVLRL